MKRQYLLKGRGAILSRGRVIAGFAAGVVLVLVVLRLMAPDLLVALARPLWGLGTSLSASAGSGGAVFENAAKLKEERDALAAQNAVLTNENTALTTKLGDLTRLLGNQTAPTPRIVAGVLARPPMAPYDVLIVGAGTNDGVALHARVFGPGGVPLGSVASVSASSAHVQLYSSPGTQTDAWIGENRTPITLLGTSAGSFTATLSKTATTTPGSPVLVSGPGALPIGSVRTVIDDPSSPTYTVEITPAVNPFSITWVAIEHSAP